MWLDVSLAIRSYIEKIIGEGSGMKILLVDRETAGIISSVVSQSYLLEHEVYLTDYLSNDSRERLGSLKCIVFVRATSTSIDLLAKELSEPRYSEYYICMWGSPFPHLPCQPSPSSASCQLLGGDADSD